MENPAEDTSTEPTKCALEEFKELEEIKGLIASLTHIYDNQLAVETAQERFLFIVDQYQEQPHLLDPHLELLLGQLLTIVKTPNQHMKVIDLAFQMLYLITKTRGYKVIVRMMPHEVADLERVLALLAKHDPKQPQSWQTRYMLFVWLSIVVMIPFDMCRLDGVQADCAGCRTVAPIMERIIDAGRQYLGVMDKSRDSSAYMLSKFLTRPDVKKRYLPTFLDWVFVTMQSTTRESLSGQCLLCGLLSLLAGLYKHGSRDDLVQFAPSVLQLVTKLEFLASKNILVRKLTMKLIQRLGLSFLKARLANWRYQRGNRSLVENLAAKPTACDAVVAAGTVDDDEEYEVPDSVEEIIEKLLSGLKDKDTVVRWSAAKGIGRITGRLYRTLADEVVGAIMELFSPTETESAWHGGCLSLAELGRRGLLLPSRLPDVIPVISKALVHDEKCGNFSFGANVRDAACYVCWSFARAYESREFEPYVNTIASMLVIVSVFDREINVRRAAAAAFQENVGRQGQFPHGIEILSTCDYFAVGNRNQCYLELSIFVAQFVEYTVPLIDHLVEHKIGHWDVAIRELASQSLQRLTAKGPEYLATSVLPAMLTKCLSADIDTHHGATLAVARIVRAVYQFHQETREQSGVFDVIDSSSQQSLLELTSKLQEAKFFKGSSGDMMRKAVCCLIENCSLCKLPFHGDAVVELWQNIIDDCLVQIDPEVQAAAVSAIPAFFIEYYTDTVDPDTRERILTKYLKELTSSVETTRSGFSLAVGALPRIFLSGRLNLVLSALVSAAESNPKQAALVAARRDALKALTNVCRTVGVVENGESDYVICRDNIETIYRALFAAMKDYTLDSRGDVGTWVREAAMTGLYKVTVLVMSAAPEMLSPDIVERMFSELAQQACEKIDRTRSHAGGLFAKLLYHRREIPYIPNKQELMTAFPLHEVPNMNWASVADTFPKFATLLSLPSFAYNVMLGLTVSTGGLTESLVKCGGASLCHYLIDSDTARTKQATDTLLKIFGDYQKVERVTLPLLKTVDQLLTSNCLSSMEPADSDSFAMSLIQLTKAEIARCGDVQRLLASVDVFCDLLQYSEEVRTAALTQLMLLLCQAYPIVRKTVASKLYEASITYGEVFPDEAVDEITSLLVETLWDDPVETIRSVRNRLCSLLGVRQPVLLKKPEDTTSKDTTSKTMLLQNSSHENIVVN